MSLRTRWEAMTNRQRDWIARTWPLFASGLLVAADWIWRQSEGVVEPGSPTSRRLLFRVGVAFVLWAVIKILFTRRWTFDGIGAVWALLGVAGAFIRVAAGWGPTPDEWERDLIQSAMDVGGVIMLLGLPVWLIVHLFHRHGIDPPWDGESERRVEQRRRWPDRRQGE